MSSLIAIDKYKVAWSAIINYNPVFPGNPSMWSILTEVFDSSDLTARVKERIISRCSSFAPLYPSETTMELVQWTTEMGAWAAMRKHEWTKAWEAYTSEYNPIDNYNRHEESKTTYDLDHPDNTTITTFVAPETAETFYNTGKSTTSGGVEQNGTVEVESDVTGNVGVTTSQQMIQSELDLRAQSFIERYIINPFIKEFAVAVY